MTPPGDGGPDLLPCPFCGGLVCADTELEPGAFVARCIQCGARGPARQPDTTLNECSFEALDGWNTRASARDAALREEGRVQGLEEAKRAVASVPVFERPTKWGEGYNMGVSDSHGAVARALASTPTPDASQGSAPVLATPDAIEAVARALWDDNAAYETENVPGVRPLPAWEEGDLVGKREARRAATAALTALRAHLDKENARG